MLISASYKTDIPAFYGEWFMRRLRAGWCKMVNPYNRQIYTVSLAPGDADGFVFWTRNLGPFYPHLREVRERGFPFIVQYTVTGYPRSLETSVIPDRTAIEHIRRLSGDFGPRVPIWRYDPILFTSETPPDQHRRKFEALAAALEGTVDEVVISFAQIYRKTRTNLDKAAKTEGFLWEDPGDEGKVALLTDLAAMARTRGMRPSICSQRQYLTEGVADARCVDPDRLGDVAGWAISASPRGHRPACGCAASKDIGDYDTCPHGCVYCYAVLNQPLALRRYREHDRDSEFLFNPLP